MHQSFSGSLVGIALLFAAAAILAEPPCVSAADGPPAARVVKKIRGRGRLPNYYANVVTEKQRDEIYKIQEEYRPKIDAAKSQLDALNKEMNEKIAAVLTAEQKKKIEETEAAAKAEKKAKADKPADKTRNKTENKAEKAEN
jgi:Spy/CpxP family protein refolding chaperone